MANGQAGIKICWLKEKQGSKFVCFIPLTIDGVGKTADKALNDLDAQATKIVNTLKAAHVKCGFNSKMIHSAVAKATWWYKDGACKSWKKDKGREEISEE